MTHLVVTQFSNFDLDKKNLDWICFNQYVLVILWNYLYLWGIITPHLFPVSRSKSFKESDGPQDNVIHIQSLV